MNNWKRHAGMAYMYILISELRIYKQDGFGFGDFYIVCDTFEYLLVSMLTSVGMSVTQYMNIFKKSLIYQRVQFIFTGTLQKV